MNKEDIIRMAREAGFLIDTHALLSTYGLIDENLQRFAALVAASEREACAAMFDNHNVWDEEVGERIRARGQA